MGSEMCIRDRHTDTHQFSGNSVVFEKIKDRHGESDDSINYELSKRKLALEWMVKNNIREHKEVSKNIKEFYADPERFSERKRLVV